MGVLERIKGLRPLRLLGALRLPGLAEAGWYRSHLARRAVDARGMPLPWYTYPAIHLLDRRLTPDMRVFEYGAGASTLWFAPRVREVVSVEHEPAWAEEVERGAPENVTVVTREEEGAYAAEIGRHGPFDLVVVDGRFRPACAREGVARLTGRGVAVVDNSERESAREVLAPFTDAGFRALALWGFGPVNRRPWETTILYREGNCLGL